MNEISWNLEKLRSMPDFKITNDKQGNLIIEANGLKYIGINGYSVGKIFYNAVIWFEARNQAEQLIKNAEIKIK